MKKQIVSILLGLTMATSMSVSAAFADTGSNWGVIKTADQMKSAISQAMEDGCLSEREEEQIIDRATDDAIAELLQEKLDAAIEKLSGEDSTPEMKQFADGTVYGVQIFDLGDGCRMSVELMDRAEGMQSGSDMLAATSTSMWKAYGNRYFTAKATVTVAGYSVMLGLENHYILSSSGIDENYGKGIYDKNGAAGLISPGEECIDDSTARTPGASDVNMHCDFRCKFGATVSKYKLDTTVEYLEHDASGKRIKVGHDWKLTKLS